MKAQELQRKAPSAGDEQVEEVLERNAGVNESQARSVDGRSEHLEDRCGAQT